MDLLELERHWQPKLSPSICNVLFIWSARPNYPRTPLSWSLPSVVSWECVVFLWYLANTFSECLPLVGNVLGCGSLDWRGWCAYRFSFTIFRNRHAALYRSSWNSEVFMKLVLQSQMLIYPFSKLFLQIQRNSLVSVALRVFEYHQGVLFLTTNRIQTFDTAFLSRFSIGKSTLSLIFVSRCSRGIVHSDQISWTQCHESILCLVQVPRHGGMHNRRLDERFSVIPVQGSHSERQYPGDRKWTCIERSHYQERGENCSGVGIIFVRWMLYLEVNSRLWVNRSKPLTLEHVLVVLRVQAKFLDDFKEQVAAW